MCVLLKHTLSERRLITAVCINNSSGASSSASCVISPQKLALVRHTPDSFTHSVYGQPLIDDSGRTVHPDSELMEIRNKVWQR